MLSLSKEAHSVLMLCVPVFIFIPASASFSYSVGDVGFCIGFYWSVTSSDESAGVLKPASHVG